MPRSAQIAVFITIALSILGLIHWYVWLRLVAQPGLPPGARRGLTATFLLLFLGIPATIYASRVADPSIRRLVSMPGYIWMGTVFILFSLVAGLDLVRLVGVLVQHLVGDVPPADPARRLTVARLFAGAVAILGSGGAALALRSGLGPFAVKEVRVRLDRLPKALSGVKIVQISDVHVGPTIGRAFVEDLVARVNALDPDIVAITGDLVDGSVAELREHVAPLEKLRTRFGTFFVTGNHEYYSGVESWCRELGTLGLRVLRNQHVTLGDERGNFDLAGIDDHEARRFGGASDLSTALAGRDGSRELILLAHQPRAVLEARRHDVGLQLSGHTHGGQIWPWKYFVYLQQPIVAGLGRFGRTLVYVSCGTGYWGPPMRLGAPAEITQIVLEGGAA
jgi:predicted MPP superfamily phosphohydrolase